MNARSQKIAPAAAQAVEATGMAAQKPRRRGGRRLLMISLPLLLALAGGAAWLLGGRYVSTDNAYVHQPMITVSPDIGGRIVEVLVGENQVVTAGTPLFRLDPTDYRIALDTAEAQLGSARLAVVKEHAAYETAAAQLHAAEMIEDVKHRELARQQALTDRGIGSLAALDEATVAARTAANEVDVAQSRLAAAAAALGGDPEVDPDTLPSVRTAIAAYAAAARNLDQTEIAAATGGTISQIESLNVGQYVSAGSGIATLVESSDTWIEANFKETQLDRLRTGQSVRVAVDAYPGLELNGEVESFGSATGSQFSLIPAQNATGNWVKVVQRVPVRIRLEPSGRPLRDGMSVKVSVDTGENRLDSLR